MRDKCFICEEEIFEFQKKFRHLGNRFSHAICLYGDFFSSLSFKRRKDLFINDQDRLETWGSDAYA